MVLLIGGTSVPLLQSSVVADLVDADATVSLVQSFANPSFGQEGKEDQEAVFQFPLQSSSAVYSFKSNFLSANGEILKTMIGKAVEKEEARERYEKAKADGKSAQLLEVNYDSSPDVFTLSIGNIPSACKTVGVEVGYYIPLLTEEQGKVKRFTLPTAVSGRYGKGGASGGNVSKEGASFQMEVNVSLTENISLIESPTHAITTKLFVDNSPSKAKVTFAKEDETLSSAFVLKVSGGGAKSSIVLQNPSSIANRDFLNSFGDSTIAKLSFKCEPKEETEDAESRKNFVFVVDRSGSMSGSSMENCRKALLLCLSSLPEDCLFNICSFGSSHSFLFPSSVEYSDDSLERARSHVQSMTADMGGTEILNPLREIVSAKAVEGVPTVVFLLTDGEVWNTDEIVKVIKKAHSESGTRLFSCGIGSGVSTHLVEGLAKAGGGTATFIAFGERMNAKLAAQMQEAMETPFADLKVDLGPLKKSASSLAWNVDESLPLHAFSGQVFSAFVAVDAGSAVGLEGKVVVTGEKGGRVVLAEVDLETAVLSNANLVVPALREEVRKTEERVKDKKSLRKRATELAVAANLVTKYTSLVAVDESNDKERVENSAEEAIKLQRIKQAEEQRKRQEEAAKEKISFDRVRRSSLGVFSAPKRRLMAPQKRMMAPQMKVKESFAAPPPMLKARMASLNSFASDEDDEEIEENVDFLAFDSAVASPPMPALKMSAPTKPVVTKEEKKVEKKMDDYDILDVLIRLQKGNGSFEKSNELLNTFGITDFGANEGKKGFITAFVLVFLEKKLASLQGEWSLMHKKASSWLAKNTNEAEVMTLANEFFTTI